MLKSSLLPIVAAGLACFNSVTAQTTCNGYSEFCSKQYSKVSYIGAHNSYGVRAVAANQNYTVTTQLDDGIRLLQVQGHMNNNELHLCHTSCVLLDAGTFESYLTEVKSWMDDNPNEVITILMVNSDGIDPTVWAAAYAASGMSDYAYQPPSVPVSYDGWPTLQELISSGKRAVNFLAQNADMSTAPYLLDEFSMVWETPYGQTDASFPCTVDRGSPASGKMYLINHYLDENITLLGQSVPVPDTSSLNQTNAATGYGSLGTQADTCISEFGYPPTFTLVDYYDVGNGSVFEYAATLNGVTYTPVQIGNSSSSSKGSTSSNDGAVTSTSLNGSSLVESWSVLQLAVLATVAAMALIR